MDVTTLGYILFLAAGVILYYALPIKHRWKWLLVLSFIFVFSSTAFGFAFVVLTSLIIYYAARKIEKTDEAARKPILILSILCCLATLVVLKYVSGWLSFFKPLKIPGGEYIALTALVSKYLLPVGISYYTLQALSYLLDIYRDKYAAEKNYWKILLFTCYFPQMLQGPISKYSELEPELFKEHPFCWQNIKFGAQLMLWGFFKKILIADRLSAWVTAIFHGENPAYGLTAIVGLIFYGIQLYCDFSGGIDIMRGGSELFGIGLKDNFRQPYFSLSLEDFWRRWHISLGQWMKDYLFYPITMSGWMQKLNRHLKKIVSRKTASRIDIAIANVIVFFFVGAWHGLGSNFLGWGLYNGLILAVSAVLVDRYAAWKTKLHIESNAWWWRAFCLVRTLTVISVGHIFDCTATAGEAVRQFVYIFTVGRADFSMLTIRKTDVFVLAVSITALLIVDILREKGRSVRKILSTKNYWVQLLIWTALVQFIVCFGKVESVEGFLYANF